MDFLDNLQVLYSYFKSRRGVGHTALLEQGMHNFKDKFILLGATKEHAVKLRGRQHNAIPVSIQELSAKNILGYDLPVAIDNFTMMEILRHHNDIVIDLKKDIANKEFKLNIEIGKNQLKRFQLVEFKKDVDNMSLWNRVFKYKKTIQKINDKREKRYKEKVDRAFKQACDTIK